MIETEKISADLGETASKKRLPESALDSSPASNSSTTPQTDNRVPEHDDESSVVALPESTQQPILETIGPSSNGNGLKGSVDARRTKSPRSERRRRRRKKALSDLGPMDPAVRNASPTSVDLKGRNGRSRSGYHNRTLSDEFGQATYEETYYRGNVSPLPPSQVLSARQQEMFMMQQHHDMRRLSPIPSHGLGRPGHHRVRSLPSGPHPFWDGQPAPHALSASGNPLIPILNQDGVPVDGGYDAGGSRRKRKQQYSGNRVRASSGSGVPQGMYGRETGDYGVGPPPQRTPEKSPGASRQFSPRGEFMSLASKFSPQKPPGKTAVTPYDPAASGRMTPPMSPAQGSYRGIAGGSPRMSPNRSPASALRRGNYGTSEESRGVSFSPGTPSQTRAMFSDEPGVPEDLIQANKKPGKHRRSAQSSRRMNMRQKSAQLYMEDTKGVEQPKACRDVLFAILFLFHLAGMVYLGVRYGPSTLKNPDAQDDDVYQVKLAYRNVIYVACLCGAFGVALSSLVLWLMAVFARRVVQVALILTIALSFAWGTIGIGLSPKNIVPITGIIALALSVGYTFVVWERIPFASANLLTALSAIRENIGTVLLSFCFQGLALGWSIYYTYVVLGVYDALLTGALVLGKRAEIFVYTMLGISYYWTFQVLLNIVQVAVAGTIGSWWFKYRTLVCDGTFSRNVLYALSLSFGSICFGSLLVGPVRLVRQLSLFFRPNQDEDSVLMCIHECLACIQNCIASFTDNLARYFNPYSFTYVGLYGYGLLDAGYHATDLFEKRGWTKIVADDLIPNILLMVSLVIGGVTGCFGFLIEDLEGLNFTNDAEAPGEGATAKAFAIGLAVGLVVTSVLFGIISSSVNAVLVCFAGSPVEFETYHQELSQEMRSAWREVWPGCMSVVDIKVAYSTGSMEAGETTPLV